jgi:hypothetical protein
MKAKIIGILVVTLLIANTIPALGTMNIEKNKNVLTNEDASNNDEYQNFLGQIRIVHGFPHFGVPLYSSLRGFSIKFTPTTTPYFEFPEVDGKVYLNFTIEVIHLLGPGVEKYLDILGHISHCSAWVADSDPQKSYIDYAYGNFEEECNLLEPQTYNFTIDYNHIYVDEILELEAGQEKECYAFLYGGSHKILLPGVLTVDVIIRLAKAGYFWWWDLIRFPNCRFPITIRAT